MAGYTREKRARKGLINYMKRPLCKNCKKNLSAVNYHKDNRVYYRSVCDGCARGTTVLEPRWARSGYKKKNKCDKCGFTSGQLMVFDVYHVDGNLNNCAHNNLKTVCANCQRMLIKQGLGWKQGDLTPDL